MANTILSNGVRNNLLTLQQTTAQQGVIQLDGVDIRELSREELRRHIAMAFEDATLFSASVRDNPGIYPS